MNETSRELEHFHSFASERIANGGASLSLEELLCEWRDGRERSEVNERLRQGIAEMNAGLGRPADEFLREFRAQRGIANGA